MLGIVSRRRLRRTVDEEAVRRAIEAAERKTSGEIRVSVAPLFWGSVEKAAWRAFERLGMDRTAARNGVLIFVVPSRRRFSVLGDEGIHEAVGQAFWDDVAGILSEHFAGSRYTEGLVAAIGEIGLRLGEHFPYEGDRDRNELPDEVDFGRGGAPEGGAPREDP